VKASATDSLSGLIAILQLAYSGERAAGYAYRGHARSVSDPAERARIRQIEDEEWHHRQLVGGMLRDLGSGPSRSREIRATLIGRALGALCHVSGWFAPMYGAGRLESHNIREYEVAARLARDCGREDLIDCLLMMAEVEWDHEAYFRGRVLSHPWSRRLTVWPSPPPKESIRAAFAPELEEIR
jgi:rubrerythrin